jgi:hypothetical protein
VSSFKIVSGDAMHQPTWPLLLKIEHMVKLQVFGNNSVLIIFTPCQIFDIINVFELLPKTCNFTICSIFSNSSHVGWCMASPDTVLKLETQNYKR